MYKVEVDGLDLAWEVVLEGLCEKQLVSPPVNYGS